MGQGIVQKITEDKGNIDALLDDAISEIEAEKFAEPTPEPEAVLKPSSSLKPVSEAAFSGKLLAFKDRLQREEEMRARKKLRM